MQKTDCFGETIVLQDLSCTYLAHHELESETIIVVVIVSWLLQQCLFINQITCPCEHTCSYEPAVQSNINLGCSRSTQHISPILQDPTFIAEQYEMC